MDHTEVRHCEGVLVPHAVVARSFSYKLNAGNFESRDFFCSRKQQCTLDEADAVSESLHQWCQQQVLADVAAYKKQLKSLLDAQR